MTKVDRMDCWIISSADDFPYFSGGATWAKSPQDAVRFCRHADANAVILNLHKDELRAIHITVYSLNGGN